MLSILAILSVFITVAVTGRDLSSSRVKCVVSDEMGAADNKLLKLSCIKTAEQSRMCRANENLQER